MTAPVDGSVIVVVPALEVPACVPVPMLERLAVDSSRYDVGTTLGLKGLALP